MFSSFHLESLLNLRELDDSIYLGYLYEDNYQVNKAKVFEYRFNGAHPKYTFLNEKEINDYLRRGIDVNTWTVDSDDIKDFLVDEGVKTIITNKDIQGKKALDFFSSSKLSSDTSVSVFIVKLVFLL